MKSIADVRQLADEAIESGDVSQLYRFGQGVGMDITEFVRSYDAGKLYVSGYWGLGADAKGALHDYRVQIDAVAGTLLAAQEWKNFQYQDVHGERLKHLERDLIETYRVNAEPGAFDMAFGVALQPWAAHALSGAPGRFVAHSKIDKLTVEFALPETFGKGWGYVEKQNHGFTINRNFAQDCLSQWELHAEGLFDDGESTPRVLAVLDDIGEVAVLQSALERLCIAFAEREPQVVMHVGPKSYSHVSEDGVEHLVDKQAFEKDSLPAEFVAAMQSSSHVAFMDRCQQMDMQSGITQQSPETGVLAHISDVKARILLPTGFGVGWDCMRIYDAGLGQGENLNFAEVALGQLTYVDETSLADGHDGWVTAQMGSIQALTTFQQCVDRLCEAFVPRPRYEVDMFTQRGNEITVRLPEANSPDGEVEVIKDMLWPDFLAANLPLEYIITNHSSDNDHFLIQCQLVDQRTADEASRERAQPVAAARSIESSPSMGM